MAEGIRLQPEDDKLEAYPTEDDKLEAYLTEDDTLEAYLTEDDKLEDYSTCFFHRAKRWIGSVCGGIVIAGDRAAPSHPCQR